MCRRMYFSLFNNIAKKVFSSEKSRVSLSSAYEVAKVNTDQFYVDNSANFKNPLIVAKLPKRKSLNTGKIESVDEIASETDYYDGSKKLRITHVSCNQWSSRKEACLHNGSCGWCGSSSTCIAGNAGGPTAPCLRGTFLFTSPTNDWNPFENPKLKATRVNFGGAQLTTFK